MFKLHDTLEEEDSLNVKVNKNFDCNACHQLAQQPVLSICGHLFCWHCIHDKSICVVCDRQFLEQQFIPIYTSHDSSQRRSCLRKLPPKPKAQLRQKIKNINSGNNSSMPQNITLNDNLQRQILLTGHGYFPSMFINAFGSFDSNDQNQFQLEDNIKGKINVFTFLLLLIVIFLILLS